MRYAIANELYIEAQPEAEALCPCCKMPVVARCGKSRNWHWSHKGKRTCDPWWENETDWHRGWKNHFPLDCQEVIHRATDGEKHIADVVTAEGWVLEFQHSPISTSERKSRDDFYKSIIWVVNGLRRKSEKHRFDLAWATGQTAGNPFSDKRRVINPNGALFRDWSGSHAHVFFDFGEHEQLWWLFPGSDAERAYVRCVSREAFIRTHLQKTTHGTTEFELQIENFRAFIAEFEVPQYTLSPARPMDTNGNVTKTQSIRRSYRL